MLNRIKDIVTTGSLSLGQIANTASVTNQFSIWDPLQKS